MLQKTSFFFARRVNVRLLGGVPRRTRNWIGELSTMTTVGILYRHPMQFVGSIIIGL